MAIKSRNIHKAAEFAKKFWTIDLARATGTTVSSLSVAALVLPFACFIEAVKVYTRVASSASTIDVRAGGASILSGAVAVATTVSTEADGTITDADHAAGTVLDVIVTQGNLEAVYASVIVQYRPFLSVPERVAQSLADES
jgi:hypothetical protein